MTALRFALVALVCYGVYYRLLPSDESVIELTPELIESVVSRHEALLARPLTDEERVAAKNDYIEEEILVREAFRRGLDRADGGIRPMLVEHARGELLRATTYEPPAPTDAQLETYFSAHAERYRLSSSVDLQQVLFPAGTASAAIEEVLVALRDGADYTRLRAAEPRQTDVNEITRSRLAGVFGLATAREIFSMPVNEWHGPFTSTVGTHLLRVTARRPRQDRSFTDARQYVREDYLRDAAERVVDIELEPIRRRYRVEIEREN